MGGREGNGHQEGPALPPGTVQGEQDRHSPARMGFNSLGKEHHEKSVSRSAALCVASDRSPTQAPYPQRGIYWKGSSFIATSSAIREGQELASPGLPIKHVEKRVSDLGQVSSLCQLVADGREL